MSKRLADRVLRGVHLSASECSVVRFVATRCDQHNVVDLTFGDVAIGANLNVRTVYRAVDRLLEAGVIHVTKRHGAPSRFTVTDPGLNSKATRAPQHLGVPDKKLTLADSLRQVPDPPRHLKSPHMSTVSSNEEPVHAHALVFTTVWNDHCGDLPSLRKPPRSTSARRLIDQAIDAADGDLELLGRAITRAATDEHYRTHRFGFETVCRHIDRWLDDRTPRAAVSVDAGVEWPRRRAATEGEPKPLSDADWDEQLRLAREVGQRFKEATT